MRKIVALLAFLVFAINANAQWNGLGNITYGVHENDATGGSVSLNDNGNIMAVYDSFVDGDHRGRVRVFELNNNVWTQIGNDTFGLAGDGGSHGNVELNREGNRFVFSSPLHEFNSQVYIGAVRVFELQNNSWVQLGSTLYGDQAREFFGTAIDINAIGNIIVAGAHQYSVSNNNTGYVKVFQYQNNEWTLLGSKLEGEAIEDEAGRSVSINSEGNRIAFSAPLHDGNGVASGHVKIYEYLSGDWVQLGSSINGYNQGDILGYPNAPGNNNIDLSSLGDRIAVASNGNYTSIYEFDGNNWSSMGDDILAPNNDDTFGGSIAINGSGNIVVIGDLLVTENGEARVFKFDGTNWTQQAVTLYGEQVSDLFGYSVNINSAGNIIIVGAPLNDGNGINSGQVKVFQNDAILDVSENLAENSIVLAPNPNTGRFSLHFSEEIENASILIVDVLGKMVYSESNISSGNMEIDQNFESGVYFVNVSTKDSEATLKMIVE